MARAFRKRRWRRPQRMTLEGPVEMRRKDLVVPTPLAIDREVAWQANRRRMGVLLVAFVSVALAEGALVGALVRAPVLGALVSVGVAASFIVVGARFGDGWIQHVLALRAEASADARSLVEALARTASVPAPELVSSPGDAPNALALGLRRRWIALTAGTSSYDRLELEALLAHEIAHHRDGDAALASAYVLVGGAVELSGKALSAPAGVLVLLAVPVWPACLTVRALRPWLFPADREHRADVVGALLSRYPPGMRHALAGGGAEHAPSRMRATDAFWFIPRTTLGGPDVAERIRLVEEM